MNNKMRQLTLKQETFCHKYIEAGNATEAYRRSYNAGSMKPATINRKASELMSNGKITARISDLKREHKARHDVTVGKLTEDLRQAVDLAREEKQASAMVSATMALAKLHGLLINKKTVSQHASVTVSYLEPECLSSNSDT